MLSCKHRGVQQNQNCDSVGKFLTFNYVVDDRREIVPPLAALVLLSFDLAAHDVLTNILAANLVALSNLLIGLAI